MVTEIVIRIDIGESLTKIRLVSRDGKILDKKILHTEAHLPYSDFIRRLKKEVDGLTAKLDAKTPILHIGAGHHQKKVL